MISADRDALLCDFAETYGIYDFRALPAFTLATLAVGLRDDSRIKMKMHGTRITRTETLLAGAVTLGVVIIVLRVLNKKKK